MKKSRLVLGTVQLGMKYGLGNVVGQPSESESFLILDQAFAAGITTFDTAASYGSAEEVLGRWIQSRDLAKSVRIVSKMKSRALDDYPVGTDTTRAVRHEVEKSLKRLQLDSLDGFLLHTSEYIYDKAVIAGLKRVKEEGLVRHIGVSTYDEPEALHASLVGVDYIQVPYNVFDQRLDSTEFFKKTKEKHITVFARSPFLQGLLLMNPHELPPHLAHACKILEQFNVFVEKYNISPFKASLLFSYIHCPAEHIVFGVETSTQLEKILAVISEAEENYQWIDEMVHEFQDIDRAIVNPSLWSKK